MYAQQVILNNSYSLQYNKTLTDKTYTCIYKYKITITYKTDAH